MHTPTVQIGAILLRAEQLNIATKQLHGDQSSFQGVLLEVQLFLTIFMQNIRFLLIPRACCFAKTSGFDKVPLHFC